MWVCFGGKGKSHFWSPINVRASSATCASPAVLGRNNNTDPLIFFLVGVYPHRPSNFFFTRCVQTP